MDASDLKAELHAKVGYQVITSDGNDSRLCLIGRIPQERAYDMVYGLVPNMLTARGVTEGHWSVDVSKKYFVSPPKSGNTVYAWRLIFEAKGQLPYEAIVASIHSASTPRETGQDTAGVVRVNARADRNDPFKNNGRGAQPTGSAIVGPAFRRS